MEKNETVITIAASENVCVIKRGDLRFEIPLELITQAMVDANLDSEICPCHPCKVGNPKFEALDCAGTPGEVAGPYSGT